MGDSILTQIIQIKDTLPKKQRVLCNYIVLNYTQAAAMTVAQLAAGANVGTTTVMRLVKDLGYDTYGSFKRDLLNAAIVRDSAAYGRMRETISGERANTDSTLALVSRNLSYVCAKLSTATNLEQFERMVQFLLDARTIYVLGYRSSYTVAQYFEDSVHLFLRKVKQLSNQQEFLYDSLLEIDQSDVLLVVSEWPCTKRTVTFAELCHKQGTPILLITNTAINPIAQFSSATIDTNSVSEKNGRLPAFIVTEALVQELGRKTVPKSIQMLQQLEDMLEENGIVMWEQET